MTHHVVVGSGASGVHYAQTVLEHGHSVTMVDVGYERPAAPHPDASVLTLKEMLSNPLTHFLGQRGEYVVYPAQGAKPYGFPPDKAYVFRHPAQWSLQRQGFDPLVSFARGGLAEAWTGGSYELDENDLADFPFALGDLQLGYAVVARRIGVSGVSDDLQRFSPMTAAYAEPLPLDRHSGHLLRIYQERRSRLNADGVYFGRSRVAVLTSDLGERRACTQLGRCLAGCPRESLYAPSYTVRELQRHPAFTYLPGMFVDRVELDGNGAATGVVAHDVAGGEETVIRSDRVVLAAGALATTRIYLVTLQYYDGTAPELSGLMDNRHVSMPFVTPALLGSDVALESYQFHHIALGIRRSDGDAHGQITALKGAQVHPIVTGLPFDLATSLRVFRRVRGALGMANLWLGDTRRAANVARLEHGGGAAPHLVLQYGDDQSDLARTEAAVRTLRRALRALGAIAPPSQTAILPRGSSVHYAGTIPMTRAESPNTCRSDGSVRGHDNLIVADGAGFSALPAKNITFSLMANAVRIARLAVDGA